MLHPCKKVDGAKYRDRDGTVYTPDENAIFYRREGAFVLITSQDKLLLIKPVDGEGFWQLPGGGIDKGETPEDAAIRETFEETGFQLQKEHLNMSHEQRVFLYLKREPLYWNYDQYYFDVTRHDLKTFDGIIDTPENGQMRWADKVEIKNVPIKHSVMPALKARNWL